MGILPSKRALSHRMEGLSSRQTTSAKCISCVLKESNRPKLNSLSATSMSTENIAQTIRKVKALVTDNPPLRESIEVLGEAISVGNISNSAGVAIGRNIRMVVNQLNLPLETVAALLD